MNENKVILVCGSRLAIHILRDLYFHNKLVAVVIPKHCNEFLESVIKALENTTIPIITVTKKDFEEQLQKAIIRYGASIGLMVSFSYKLPASVYSLPIKGFYNVHPGLLPAYRGADPVFQQIKNRESYAGATIHKVEDDFDTGPIVLTEKIPLLKTDTHGMLTSKLAEVATRMVDTLISIVDLDSAIPSRIQNESKAGYYKKQTAFDIAVNWETMDGNTIIALINACNPWNKGAITMLNSKIIRLLHASVVRPIGQQEELPGTIISIDEHAMTVATIQNEAICVQMIYMDEGFIQATCLRDFGILPGNRFNSLHL